VAESKENSNQAESVAETVIENEQPPENNVSEQVITSGGAIIRDDWDVVNPAKTKMGKANDEVFSLSQGNLTYMIVAIVSLVVGVLIGAIAFGGNDNAVTESQLRIILNEALSGADFSSETLDIMDDDDPYRGPLDAPVVIVEFSDFLCSFCGRHYRDTLTPLLERYDGLVRYVYRDFPGVGGQFAYIAAMAAECADDQGEFWAYHDTLFNNQSSLSGDDVNEVLIGYASDLGLDVPIFTTCFEEQEHLIDVQLDRADGQSIGATGTPAFLINGRFVSGAQPFDFFVAFIDRELESLGIAPPAS